MNFVHKSIVVFISMEAFGIAVPDKNAVSSDSTLPTVVDEQKTRRHVLNPSFDEKTLQKKKQVVLKSKVEKNEPTEEFIEEIIEETIPPPPPPPVVVENVPIKKEEFTQTLYSDAPQQPTYYDLASGVRVFSRNIKRRQEQNTITLPSTAVALGTVLYGAQVVPNTYKPVAIELNYAWLGPNGALVEMKGCRLWANVTSNMNTERLEGTTNSMTCRAINGNVFEIPITAHLVNKEDEYLGAKGTLVLPGKALSASLQFLKGGVNAFGEAMAAAQVASQVATGQVGSPMKSENLAGSENRYLLGKSLAGSTSNFLDWYIDFYKSLSPHLAMGPGHKVYLAVQGSVQVPKIFFGEQVDLKALELQISTQKNLPKSNTNNSLTSGIQNSSQNSDFQSQFKDYLK